MKNRLRRQEKQIIKAQCESLQLYQMLYAPCKSYEQEMSVFRLSSEEAFYECIEVLDYIKSHYQKESLQYIKSLYNTLYCDYRDLAPDNTTEEELSLSVSVVIYSLIMLFTQSDKRFYYNLSVNLLSQLTEKHIDVGSLQARFMTAFFRMDAEDVRAAFSEYMSSDDFLSDQLQTAIAAVKDNFETTEKSRQFTQKQAIIFVTEALNVALTEVNLSEMARLLEKLTGYKGTRSLLQRYKNNQDEYNAIDTQEVAAALQGLCPELAKKIKNSVIE